MPRLPGMDKITQVIEAAGGVSALASKLDVRPPTVHQWVAADPKQRRKVSPRLSIAISQLWPELVTVHDLRPDIFGPASQGEQGNG